LATALALGAAQAQTTPAEPFQPGAALSDAPAPEAAKPMTKPATEIAEDAAPKPAGRAKPRKPEGGPALTVVINNKRSVGLVQLTIAPAGGEPRKVAGPLAFGRKTTARIPRAKDCLYDIRGHFADEADTEHLGVDLCKDRNVNLTDE
jgi:hypothetical protein